MRSFEQIANDDPEISHMMHYRRIRQFVRMCDKLHRAKSKQALIVAFNEGGISNVGNYSPSRIKPCAEWDECADQK